MITGIFLHNGLFIYIKGQIYEVITPVALSLSAYSVSLNTIIISTSELSSAFLQRFVFLSYDPKTKILDIGCGNAPIPLILSTKTNAKITGVEIQKEVYDLAVESVKLNNFDGSGNITTANWGTARNITIGSTSKSVNGSGNVGWTLAEIGAAPTVHNHTFIESIDTRSTNPDPNTYTARGITPEFKSTSSIGLPNVGKSTLFNALTNAGAESANYPFCTIDPNVGIVPVPDKRIQLLGDLYKTPGSVVCDTHCIRICGRLGLSAGKEPEKVEQQLRKCIPAEESNDFCHRCVLHGRDTCVSGRPKCGECEMQSFCKHGQSKK